MKFKCRKCEYFGNKHTCPKCDSGCILIFRDDVEEKGSLYMLHTFMDKPETSLWSDEYEPTIKEMEQRGMVKIIKKKDVRVAYKIMEHPIWMELVIHTWKHNHM